MIPQEMSHLVRGVHGLKVGRGDEGARLEAQREPVGADDGTVAANPEVGSNPENLAVRPVCRHDEDRWVALLLLCFGGLHGIGSAVLLAVGI